MPEARTESDKAPGVAGRQKHAASGKELPVAADGETLVEQDASQDTDTDEDEGAADTPFAWFATAPLVADPRPIAIGLPIAGAATPAIEGDSAAPVPDLHVPGGTAEPSEAVAAEALPQDFMAGDTGGDAQGDAKPQFEVKAEAPIKIELPAAKPETAPVALAALQQLRSEAAPEPMLVQQRFSGIEAPAPRRPAPRDIALSALSQAVQTDAPRPAIVQPVAEAQQPAIDTSRQQWMADMIETVAALRETPGSRETMIRLSPDALGTVDVSIRQEGDRVHVRIHAETPAARQLLSEAQPKLMELAEARGIRLGQTAVEAGVSGQGHQRQEQHAPGAPIHNRTAAPAETEANADANTRVA